MSQNETPERSRCSSPSDDEKMNNKRINVEEKKKDCYRSDGEEYSDDDDDMPSDDEKINNKIIRKKKYYYRSDGEEFSDEDLGVPSRFWGTKDEIDEIALRCLDLHLKETGKKLNLIKVTKPVINVGNTYSVTMELADADDDSIRKVCEAVLQIQEAVLIKFEAVSSS